MAYRSPYPDIKVPPVSLFDMVLGKAGGHADKVAMADGITGRRITYGELVELIRKTAAGLAARGIKKGDVVSIWAPNVPDWPIAFFATVRLGAIVHTSNPVSTPDELAYQLADGNAKMLITVNALADKARVAIEHSQKQIELFTFDQTPDVPLLASIMVDAEPPAVAIDSAQDIV
ncbi:MAG TPA: AMP-binding protein, partial [Vicinamibacterales bacterium]|nr:AMP-binding protein [Vicinamibacterales bacterium]